MQVPGASGGVSKRTTGATGTFSASTVSRINAALPVARHRRRSS